MIYDNVKKFCKEKEITISYLEKECGLSNGSIRKWNLCIPSVDKIQKVSTVLNVSIEDLIKD